LRAEKRKNLWKRRSSERARTPLEKKLTDSRVRKGRKKPQLRLNRERNREMRFERKRGKMKEENVVFQKRKGGDARTILRRLPNMAI